MKASAIGASAAVTVFLEISIPFVLAFIFARKLKVGWKYFGFGALVFVIVQIPHLGLLLGLTFLANSLIPPHALSPFAQTAVNSILLGLLAGLFEELGRYLTFSYWLKEIRSFKSALMFGAGWGGIESIGVGITVAISIVSLIAVANLDMAKLPARTKNSLSTQQRTQLAQQKIQAKKQIERMRFYEPLISLFERIMTIVIQLSFTLIVLQAFIRNRFFYVWVAVIYHALVDGLAVALAKNVFFAESAVGIFALFSLAIIFSLGKNENRGEGMVA